MRIERYNYNRVRCNKLKFSDPRRASVRRNPSSEEDGRVWEIIKRRLLDALFLTHRNLANYIIEVKGTATVDAHGCELYRNR